MVITTAGAGAALDASLPTVYREFRLLRDETGVMRSTATSMPLAAHEGSTKYINNYDRFIAYNVSEGADITQAQAMADAATGYSPSEVAVQAILSGRTMRRVADPDLQGRCGRALSNAYDLKEDTDGCVQLQSFTGTTLGSAGTVISPGHISGGAARIMIGNSRANPEPYDDIFAVIHPLSAHVLAARLTPYGTTPAGGTAVGVNTGAHVIISPASGAASTSRAEQLIRRGYKAIGTVGGCVVKTDANIAVDASTDDCTGAIFAKDGLIYVSELEPTLKWDTSDVSMRGAAEGNCFGSYVWGNYRPARTGNPLLFDASLPTS